MRAWPVRRDANACLGLAQVGRGFPGSSVHGGAVETALDESTAECAKARLFPLASTYAIEFKIKKPVQVHTTYQIRCEVVEEHVRDVKYVVSGELFDYASNPPTVFATCRATMVNPPRIQAEQAGAPVGLQ